MLPRAKGRLHPVVRTRIEYDVLASTHLNFKFGMGLLKNR